MFSINYPRKLMWAAVLLTAVLIVGCAFLPRGFAQTAVSDIVSALLMLTAFLAFAWNGATSKGRIHC